MKTPQSLTASSYWDCRLTKRELWLLLLAFVMALALHLSPVLNSGLAKPLIIVLALLCFFSPFTGFFFIGASAILPTASADIYAATRQAFESGDIAVARTMVDSATKFGFIAWAIVTFVKSRRLSFRGIELLWPLAPLLLWQALTNGQGSVINGDVLKDVLFCVMACQLANESKGQYLKCLLGMCLGCLVVIVGYWANAAGLPVILATWGGERGGFERMGGVVADSVMLWPPLLTGIGGIVGLAFCLESRLNPLEPPKWIGRLAGLLFIASVPPLVATMANGALVGFALMMLAVVVAYLWVTNSGSGLRPLASGKVFMLLISSVAIIAGMAITDSFQVRTKLEALAHYYNDTSEAEGLVASRTGVWTASLDTISRYPLTGVDFNDGVEHIPAQYADNGYFLSHNVFLDYGRHSGIPGMLLFAWFFFWPLLLVWERRSFVPHCPFLLSHFAFLIFFMSLSFYTYKVFWGFWMLMAMAASKGRPGLSVAAAFPRFRDGTESSGRERGHMRSPTAVLWR